MSKLGLGMENVCLCLQSDFTHTSSKIMLKVQHSLACPSPIDNAMSFRATHNGVSKPIVNAEILLSLVMMFTSNKTYYHNLPQYYTCAKARVECCAEAHLRTFKVKNSCQSCGSRKLCQSQVPLHPQRVRTSTKIASTRDKLGGGP